MICDRRSPNYIDAGPSVNYLNPVVPLQSDAFGRQSGALCYTRTALKAPAKSGMEPSRPQQDPDVLARAGGWLFRHRTWIPFPIIFTLLVIPARNPPRLTLFVGVVLVLAGELLRIWAVLHIGVISRTRSKRLGPLIATGPF